MNNDKYYLKYLKYKNKYCSLKEQYLNIFDGIDNHSDNQNDYQTSNKKKYFDLRQKKIGLLGAGHLSDSDKHELGEYAKHLSTDDNYTTEKHHQLKDLLTNNNINITPENLYLLFMFKDDIDKLKFYLKYEDKINKSNKSNKDNLFKLSNMDKKYKDKLDELFEIDFKIDKEEYTIENIIGALLENNITNDDIKIYITINKELSEKANYQSAQDAIALNVFNNAAGLQ